MLVLLAAAVVAAEPVADMPNLYRPPAHCADARHRVVDRDGRPALLPLGRLPRPTLQLTVDRRIDGCPVITIAHGPLQPAGDQPNPPASEYRLEPLRAGE